MGSLRFRRTFGLGPGLRLNVNKRSLGVSAGIPGFRFSVNTDGRRTRSIGVPGTGLYHVSSTKGRQRTEPRQGQTDDPTNTPSTVWLTPSMADQFVPEPGLFASRTEKDFRNGVVAYLKHDWQRAAALFQAAVDQDTSNISDDYFLAGTLLALGRVEEAASGFEHVIARAEMLPDELMAKYLSGPIRLRVAVTPEITVATEFDARGAALMLAEAYQVLGRTDEAIGVIHELAEVYPNESVLTLSLAELLLEVGDPDGVIAVTEGIRKRDDVSLAIQRLRATATDQLRGNRHRRGESESDSGPIEDVTRDWQPVPDLGIDPRDQLEAADVLPKVRRSENAPLPVDPVSGCLVPGPGYPLSFPWRPGSSAIEIHRSAAWLEAPLAPGVGFVHVDLLGVHALAERMNWGYGNVLIGEVGRRLQQRGGDSPTFRTGADAFLVTTETLEPADVETFVNETRALVSEPVPYPGLSTSVGLACSVGVAISKGGEDASQLFERVLNATSEALQRGANQFVEA